VIVALGGNDVINAHSGEDLVCAGDGNDRIDAGDGFFDGIDGGAGDDWIDGGDAALTIAIYKDSPGPLSWISRPGPRAGTAPTRSQS
jgi:hypothetical protein